METVREKLDIQAPVSETEEAQRHNAMINERYRMLQNAIADQFYDETQSEQTFAEVSEPAKSLYISPSEVNTAAVEQAPTVTEYVSPMASALFTTQKFEMIQSELAKPNQAQAIAPAQVTAIKTEAQYSLTPFAKILMAVATFVIITMLAVICINTQIINQKSLRIKNLEQKKEQLLEQNEEIQRRIENARSEETIKEFAESQGMVWVGN